MRILYAITKTELGGAQTHLYELMKHAVMKGWEVALISDKREGWLFEKARDLGVLFFENRHFKNSFNPLNLFASFRKIQRIVSEFRPNLVHVHSGSAGFMVRYALKKKVPTIFTAHGWSFTPGTPIFRRVIAEIAERFVARFTTKIICVSKNDYHLAVEKHILHQENIVQIYNSTSIPTRNEGFEKGELINILFLGRFTPPKDLFVLFNAFSRLPDSVRDKAEITVVGDGPLFERWRSHAIKLGIEERVFWHGRQTYESSRRFFEEADIFVIPTHWEGFPMTILEAMSFGLPVIASGVGGVPEIVDESVGFLVDKENQEIGFQRALEMYIENPELRKEAGQRGRLRIKNSYSLEEFLRRTFDVYETSL
jgi:glycosyltransferase involved in cell wall biosynthesis